MMDVPTQLAKRVHDVLLIHREVWGLLQHLLFFVLLLLGWKRFLLIYQKNKLQDVARNNQVVHRAICKFDDLEFCQNGINWSFFVEFAMKRYFFDF